MLSKIKNDLLYIAKEGEYTIRVFKNKKEYNNWVELVKKEGHSMKSFYKIEKMISQYTPLDKKLFIEIVEKD